LIHDVTGPCAPSFLDQVAGVPQVVRGGRLEVEDRADRPRDVQPHHVGPGAGERDGAGPPDAAGRAGHHRDAAGEVDQRIRCGGHAFASSAPAARQT
jgi:hypothetical protein